MIEKTTMQTHEHTADTDFWSDVYRERTIAILNHYGRLYVYLDHILQHNVVFADRADARGWLIQRIDQAAVPCVSRASRPIVRVAECTEALRAA